MNSILRTRAKLSETQAIDIFQIKKTSPTLSAAQVAKLYCISEKALRDIWTGRTWTIETWHLDTTRILFQKDIGRPKGCRDSKPRMMRKEKDVSRIGSDNYVCTALGTNPKEWRGQDAKLSAASRTHPTAVGIAAAVLDRMDALSKKTNVPHCPPKALSPSPPTTSSVAASVDQQLHDWNQAFWLEHESADPFHDDWGLQRADASVVTVGVARA